ncbi:MAG: hypothetical protein JWR74_313, partial [Polaromonas sp.]|nr:hypothetical protein [Polaromonas sp.]
GNHGGLTGKADRTGMTVVHAVRRHVASAQVSVPRVVPDEEGLTVGACILNAANSLAMQLNPHQPTIESINLQPRASYF